MSTVGDVRAGAMGEMDGRRTCFKTPVVLGMMSVVRHGKELLEEKRLRDWGLRRRSRRRRRNGVAFFGHVRCKVW